jgi:hypothetical protein
MLFGYFLDEAMMQMSLRFREGTVVSRGEIWSLGFRERTV